MSKEEIDNLLLGVDLNAEIDKSQPKVVCKNCKSQNLVIDNTKGHMVCTDCAVINKEYLDENPDPISNDSESNNNSRYGAPSSFFFPKASLGTKIVTKGCFSRLSLLQAQGQMPYREHSLNNVLIEIQNKCKYYKITPQVMDAAKLLYKQVSESVHLKGKRKGKNIIMRCVNRRSYCSMSFSCL